MWHLPCLPYIYSSVFIYLRHVQGANLCNPFFRPLQVFFKKFLRGLLSLEGERTVSFSRRSRLFHYPLRCFDTVFQRPYRYFSIVLKVVFSLSDRYKIVTSNWLWIGICENVVLSKIDITVTTINKKL